MASRFFSFLFVLLFYCSAFSQNLVPNPSFEDYANVCPVNLNEMPLFWGKWRSSPNSFNTCVEPQNHTDSLGWAPWNGFGYQEPASGESYVGLYAFSPSPSPSIQNNFREYLGCQLLEPLVVGTEYYVSFKVSSGRFGSYYNITYASSHLGVLFTMQDYQASGNPLPIPNFAHIYTEETITDTLNWVTISGNFIPDQPYTHLCLGVFFEFEMLNVEQYIPGLSLGSYYFADDVCVSVFPDCWTTTSISKPSTTTDLIKINPNPANSIVRINAQDKIDEIMLFDTKGVLILNRYFEFVNNTEIDVSNVLAGYYVVVVKSGNIIKREKLVIVH